MGKCKKTSRNDSLYGIVADEVFGIGLGYGNRLDAVVVEFEKDGSFFPADGFDFCAVDQI